MQGPQLTKAFLVVWIAVAIIYDVWVNWRFGENSTISVVMGRWAYAEPVVPFAIGMLMGHLFWRWTHPGMPLRPPMP